MTSNRFFSYHENVRQVLKLLGGIIVIAVAVFVWSWINSPLIVTVVGTGEVSVPATVSTLSLTVTGSASDAATAISSARAKADSLKNILKQTGISETNIATAQISVTPPSALLSSTNFIASLAVGADKIPASKTEGLISALYSGGATLVSQPVVSFADQNLLEEEAFNQAMYDAQRQADIIAKKDHKVIKKIIAVTQSTTPASTVTSQTDNSSFNPAAYKNTSFKIFKSVSVSWKMW